MLMVVLLALSDVAKAAVVVLVVWGGMVSVQMAAYQVGVQLYSVHKL
jgi:cell division protein FtsL